MAGSANTISALSCYVTCALLSDENIALERIRTSTLVATDPKSAAYTIPPLRLFLSYGFMWKPSAQEAFGWLCRTKRIKIYLTVVLSLSILFFVWNAIFIFYREVIELLFRRIKSSEGPFDRPKDLRSFAVVSLSRSSTWRTSPFSRIKFDVFIYPLNLATPLLKFGVAASKCKWSIGLPARRTISS